MNYYPTAYNPNTHVAYGAGQEGCSEISTREVAPEDVMPGEIFLAGAYGLANEQRGSIKSIDVTTGSQVSEHITSYPNNSGVLVTPDLVWSGDLDGTFAAYDATTLERVWSINLGTAFRAPPMTYAVDGKQYVAIMGGPIAGNTYGHAELETMQGANMVWVFALN